MFGKEEPEQTNTKTRVLHVLAEIHCQGPALQLCAPKTSPNQVR